MKQLFVAHTAVKYCPLQLKRSLANTMNPMFPMTYRPHFRDTESSRRAEVSSILAQEHRKSLRRVKAPSKQSCLWPYNMGGTHGGVVSPPIFYLWGMGQSPFMEKSSRKEFNRVDHS